MLVLEQGGFPNSFTRYRKFKGLFKVEMSIPPLQMFEMWELYFQVVVPTFPETKLQKGTSSQMVTIESSSLWFYSKCKYELLII